MHYVKLFGSLLDSTIWQESADTRLTWITMLAMADWDGEVHASIPGLAKRAGVTIPECEAALKVLASPDPYSRSKEKEGRRIEDLPQGGGWLLINHKKYKNIVSTEARRRYQAEHLKKSRAAKKARAMSEEEKTKAELQQAAEAPPLATDEIKEFE